MKLEIGLNAISSYKRLAYTPWHAIAEFVDNSTQSFFNNRNALLEVALSGQRPLTVNIKYERDNDILHIEDNAMGMSLEELERGLQVARPPVDTSGRSKYGMGLKTSASWIGNHWTIRTKKLGNPYEYTVVVDVEKVATGNNTLNWSERVVDQNDHYTIVEIRKLNRRFYTRTLTKIGDYLSSMYRQDFRNEVLTLIWQEQILRWEELDAKLLNARDGSIYKKDFEFYIESDEADEAKRRKRVFGWVGVLAAGSRSRAGFSILHSGRVIKGWPEAWRPESLYGQIQGTNDLINQRLVGEINLDDFDVSHTKDDILWLGDEEDLVQEKLREHCGEYREIAKSYRKKSQDERGPSEVAVRSAVDKFKTELNSPEMRDIVASNPDLPETLVNQVVESIKGSVIGKIPETFSAMVEGVEIKGYVDEMSINDPYLTIDTPQPDKIIIIVNSSHPHWAQLSGAEGVLNYLRHCTYDGIAEWQASQKSSRSVKINPNTVKLLKDRLLRVPLEIEQNSDDNLEEIMEE